MGAVDGLPVLTVELSHREVMAASAEANVSAAPSPVVYMLVMSLVFIGAMELGLSLAFMVSQNFGIPWMMLVHQVLSLALPVLIFLLGLWAVNNGYNRIAHDRQARQIASLGTPETVPATFTIETQGLRLETPRGEWLAKWASVNRLVRTSEGWLLGNDLGSQYVPRRAFADAEQEAAWVAAINARIGHTT